MSKAKSFSKYKSRVINWQLFLTLARKRERKYVSRCCWCWLCEGKDKQSNTTWPPFAIFDCTGGNTIFWWGLMSGLSLIRLSDTFSHYIGRSIILSPRPILERARVRVHSDLAPSPIFYALINSCKKSPLPYFCKAKMWRGEMPSANSRCLARSH